jgi:hypothetical protein
MKRDFGWHILKGQGFQIVSYIVFLIIVILLDLRFVELFLLIVIYLTIRTVHKKQSFKTWLKGVGIVTCMLLLFYAIGYFIGGILALILMHIIGCGLIIYGHKEIIKKANKEIQAQAQFMAKKQKGYSKWKAAQKK